jgi:hypothetical protein
MNVIRDPDIVREFMNRPEIYRYAAEYGSGKIEPSMSGREVWLGYEIDGELIGLANIYVVTGSMCMCHPYIVRKHRDKYEDMLKSIFKWFVDAMPLYAIKLNALIPTIFKNTIQAVKNVGGKVEGIDRQSYRHSESRVLDRVLMGITREEMGNV